MSTVGSSESSVPTTSSNQPTSDSLPVQQNAPPITKIVHEALLALGQGAAIFKDGHGAESSGNLSHFENILQRASHEAAEHMLLGQEYDIGTLFTVEGWKNRYNTLNRSRPTLSPGYARAQEIRASAIARSDDAYVEYISGQAKDHLARNVQNLEWCNMVWSQLCTSGAELHDYVRIFVQIIVDAMRVRCPLRDFPSQWSAIGALRTLDELKVIQLSASIREKPEWRLEIQEENIVSKWREEAYSQDVTPSMFEFLIAELHWFAEQYDPKTGIEHATVPGVFVSDNLIPVDDHTSLRTGANGLAAIPEAHKDWHPKSNGQVLDLVHPSLYSYVRGRTRRFLDNHRTQPVSATSNMDAVAEKILNFLKPPVPKARFSGPLEALAAAGHGVATSASMHSPDLFELKWRSNSVHQWPPVDVEVSAGPDHVSRFLSYVNNLYPAPNTPGGRLYPVHERIFSRFIPLFEHTLTATRLRRTGNDGVRTEFLDEDDNYWDIPEPSYDDEDEDVDTGALMDERRDTREFVRPIVKPFLPKSPGEAQVTLGGRTLQLIIKMANVHLTPEKPEYAGGSWHVEGTDNECIVATGIYYFESENISDSSLSFRQAFDGLEYNQDEFDHVRQFNAFPVNLSDADVLSFPDFIRYWDFKQHLEYLYNILSGYDETSQQANQLPGAVTTFENRCICFPNGMQHRLSPFELNDPTKPGHRKILVFFLVDPSMRILSTSDVPPQQLDWLLGLVRLQTGTRSSNLPPELFDLICEYVREDADGNTAAADGSPLVMTMTEAKEHRLDLMDERADFIQVVNEEMYERGFSLCEH